MFNHDTAAAIRHAAKATQEAESARRKIAQMQSKMATQRNEIARLSQKLENVTKQKMDLLDELKWLKGER